MFSRRRSRGHYDPQQYNAGISTPSASASAAANAFYMKQLGPSAAAEALRRHSLDQNGSNAIRDFQMNSRPSPVSRPGVAPRRANSLTTRSYQVVHTTPNRSAGPRVGRSPSIGYSPSLSSGPPRRNSLSSDRTNSLTRTHTTVNRDAGGRTLSLTTTTIRQMGSFELVSTKDIPIASPGGHFTRPAPSFTSDYSSRTNSLKSMDSELVGIQEEPEEDIDALRGRLNRLGDPIDIPLTEDPDEEGLDEPSLDFGQDTRRPNTYSSKAGVRVPSGTKKSVLSPDIDADGIDGVALADGTADGTAAEQQGDLSDASEASEATLSDGTVSDATPSPASADRVGARSTESDNLQPPSATSEPLHREVSPSRSALRNNNGSAPKTKVSFGGADEPYVYESYEYDDVEDPTKQAQSPGVAAATAAARFRSQQQANANTSAGSMLGASAGTAPQSRRRLVLSQPVLNVEKRPSQTSLSGKGASTARLNAPNMPYPHARPWDVQSESFVDAPSSLTDIPVPARSNARPRSSITSKSSQRGRAGSQPLGPSLGGLGGSGGLGLNGLPKGPEPELEEEEPDTDYDQIHAQAVALAQAAFNNQNAPSSPTSARTQSQQQQQPLRQAPLQQQGSSHAYRSLLEDDAASIRSDSSFTRENRRTSRVNGGAPSRMRSLRQPATPSLRTGAAQSKKGRKGSLLNQEPPNLDIGGYASPNNSAAGAAGPGLRTFSLRQNSRPDPSALLSGSTVSNHHGNSNSRGGFRSRIADSDSEDEGFAQKVSGKKKSSNSNGKISFGDVFSPSTDVKDIFKSRASSDGAVIDVAKPRKKSGGFFKRVFGKKT